MVNEIWTTFSPVPVSYSVLSAPNACILPIHLLMNERKRIKSLVYKVSVSCRGLAVAAVELCSAWCDEIIGMSAETRSESGHATQ